MPYVKSQITHLANMCTPSWIVTFLFTLAYLIENYAANLPIVSPVSSSSPTSTQRIENGGSKWAKPSRGGLEQLVTN